MDPQSRTGCSPASDPLTKSHSRLLTTLPGRLFAVQLCVAAGIAPWYAVYGLRFDWRTMWALPPAYLALIGAWLYSRRYAAHPRKYVFPDVLLAVFLLLVLTNIASPAQYLAIALRRPLIDDWLVQADAWLGFDVKALAVWTAAHPTIATVLSLSYATLLPQFLLPVVVLGLRHRDLHGMWEYVFHFQFCLLITVATLAIFPAECSYTHLGYTPTIDQARVIRQIAALRAGSFHVIDFTDLDGLVSMPSFHAAGALMVTWAFRHHRQWLTALGIVNAGLIAATFMSGAHYFVDVLGAIALFAVSVGVYRLVIRERVAVSSVTAAPAWAPLQEPRATPATTR